LEHRDALLVVGDPVEQQQLIDVLQRRKLRYVAANTVDGAVDALTSGDFRLTLLDLSLAGASAVGGDGLDLVYRLKLQAGDPGAIISLAAANGDGPSSEAPSLAVADLIRRPFRDEEVDETIERVLLGASAPSSPAPDDQPGTRVRSEMSLWRSPKMRAVREILCEAAGVDVTVLITGETGTGKDVVARAIHAMSSRRSGPFVKVNCAAVPRELLESELFGHERGAFTGAHRTSIGKFESAHRGTIFLDEIGDLHPALQAKLLHVLQDGDFSRVGGKATLKTDVRVLAATNQDLEKAVADGRFREDLFYRLNVVHIVVPPLRDRVEEIPVLAEYFVDRYARLFRRSAFSLSPAVLNRLLRHRYPGNVRELENVIKRMIVLGDPLLARTALAKDAPEMAESDVPAPRTATICLKEIVQNASLIAERAAIAQVLEQTGWNRVRAAKVLRISYRALLYKMKRVGLHGPRPPRASISNVNRAQEDHRDDA
jgi:two-component system response regulator AtoC